MAAQPPRRTTPAPHLLPQVVPVEKALLARAEAIEADADLLEAQAQKLGPGMPPLDAIACRVVATEFRALADELHYWD